MPDGSLSSRCEIPAVAIVGATGAVGRELIRCLERRQFPLSRLQLLASSRSAGAMIDFRDEQLRVEDLAECSFHGIDIVLFSAGASTSTRYAPAAVSAGAVVVDNSSAFRMDSNVPLVVPEVNGRSIRGHRGIIANPNCVAAIIAVALGPLESAFGVRRVNMATYQAASGAGAAAMAELRNATAAALAEKPYGQTVFPHPCAFNFFSHNSEVDPVSGYNGEELKAVRETRRILDRPDLPISATCIRVPTLRAHGVAISVELDCVVAPEEVRDLLRHSPGVALIDDREGNHFPMPSDATGREDVLVGRIRTDLSDPSSRTIAFFIVGDQLLKGAALNAVQIAELLNSVR